MERGRSPKRKKAKVLSDESMPKATKGKQQQSIRSYGKNGSNRDKYIRKNPRNSIPENSQPIEVRPKGHFYKANLLSITLKGFGLGQFRTGFLLPTLPTILTQWLRGHSGRMLGGKY